MGSCVASSTDTFLSHKSPWTSVGSIFPLRGRSSLGITRFTIPFLNFTISSSRPYDASSSLKNCRISAEKYSSQVSYKLSCCGSRPWYVVTAGLAFKRAAEFPFIRYSTLVHLGKHNREFREIGNLACHLMETTKKEVDIRFLFICSPAKWLRNEIRIFVCRADIEQNSAGIIPLPWSPSQI